jgi:hypothetical protein
MLSICASGGGAPFAMHLMPDLSLSAAIIGGGQLGLLMRIASAFSFVIVGGAQLRISHANC